MRPMGRDEREASPMNVQEMPEPATKPMQSREPVPAFPKSSGWLGSKNPPTPTPFTRHVPSLSRITRLPNARIASAVAITSSDSKRPLIVVSPIASAPNMSERWEIDLSPGTRTTPDSPLPRGDEVIGVSACAETAAGPF